MTKDPNRALASAVVAGLTICLWGCQQAVTVPGSLPYRQSSWASKMPFAKSNARKQAATPKSGPPHEQSSWLSKIPFAKPKGVKRTIAAQSGPPHQQSSWLAKMPLMKPLMKPKDGSAGTVTTQQKVNVQMAIARSLEEQGEIDQAVTVYLNVVRNDDRRADAYHRLAVLHDRQGQCEKSAKFYREALKRDPQNATLHCDLGYSYYLQRRWGEAEASLRRSLELDPRSARAHSNLALLLAHTERAEEALGEFTRAGCSETDSRTNLAFAMMLQQQWEEAHGQYELALTADPASTRAQDGLKMVRSLATVGQQSAHASCTDSRDERPVRVERGPVHANNGPVHVGFVAPPADAPLPR